MNGKSDNRLTVLLLRHFLLGQNRKHLSFAAWSTKKGAPEGALHLAITRIGKLQITFADVYRSRNARIT
jgi:hypothetical protein